MQTIQITKLQFKTRDLQFQIEFIEKSLPPFFVARFTVYWA